MSTPSSRQTNGDAGKPPRKLKTKCLADVEMRPPRWLVPNRIPEGQLLVLAGRGGAGKTAIVLSWSADLTRGRCWMGLEYDAPAEGEVLYCSPENDPASRLAPGILAAGGDRKHFHLIEGAPGPDGSLVPFSLEYAEALENTLRARKKVRLVIIDPASAYVANAGVNDWSESEVRSLLTPLEQVAGRTRVTIVLVLNLNKRQGAEAVDRVANSAAYVNAARASYIAGHTKDGEQRGLAPLKVNDAPPPSTLAYEIQPLEPKDARRIVGKCPKDVVKEDRKELALRLVRVVWSGPVEIDPEELVFAGRRRKGDEKGVESCVEFLLGLLTQYAYPVKEVKERAAAEGYLDKTLERAKTKLREGKKLYTKRIGGKGGVFWWGRGEAKTWTLRPGPKESAKG